MKETTIGDKAHIMQPELLLTIGKFLLHSPRLCDLKDKEKSGVFMEEDEVAEAAALRAMSNLYNLLTSGAV